MATVRYHLTNYKNLNFLEVWQHIFLDLSTFKEIYPETPKLISILINCPLTNAQEVSSEFKLRNLIKVAIEN
ncbi:28288_t:CDS:2 [Gigaspora margarita]|uniref:28288_t:CDS:1 n=1 Tax=Gigaspora margarita TaxID=4874 RepID=A0ABM8W747_GIGMA|nr:28288_t:CDS:2 [Gigaspora margarita]